MSTPFNPNDPSSPPQSSMASSASSAPPAGVRGDAGYGALPSADAAVSFGSVGPSSRDREGERARDLEAPPSYRSADDSPPILIPAGAGPRLEPVRHLAQFEVVRRLGAGGMAEVFLAKKRGAEGTFKVLVVKRILPSFGRSSRFRLMFRDEALLATRLNHPNVVQVYEFFDAGDEGHLLSMEYVEGPDLGTLLDSAKQRGVRLPPWIAGFILAEAAKGLHYAHEKKDEGGTPLDIVHRDVSPQNVLLSFDGSVKIADFGIASARLIEEEKGVLKGKFRYMSPEQARAEKVDRRSDLYALGVILWECLAGRPLHGGLGGEALLDIVRSGIVEPPSSYVTDVPPELEAITMKALSPRASDRFQTGREFAAAIARATLIRQELIDTTSLEATIAELVRRENTRPGVSEPPAPPEEDVKSRPPEFRTQAAAPMALSAVEGPGGVPLSLSLPGDSRSMPGVSVAFEELNAMARAMPHGPREVRHVALVTLKLHGLDVEMSDRERAEMRRALERLRTMLGDMAYKREMRWTWKGDGEAQAVAGLGSKPGQAAADSVSLALETHEAIAGFKDDVPREIGAGVGIVRGIASGVRDPEGNLVRFQIHDPASYLAEVVSQATPLHATWVAGGVYRLVRRDFLWGDAPTLSLDERLRVKNLPPNMRIYALERSLSREEREGALAGGSSDLVGRDAEKADLHAAFHEAVNAGGGSGSMTVRAVIGELGIGKTALAATFVNELPPHARLVRVECSPSRMEVPFASVADLVRDIVQATADEPFVDVASRIASVGGGAASGDATNPMVARLAELATNRQVARGDDEDAHYRKKLVTSGVRMLLAALALEQPLVLVIDGLQWADKASLELFGEVLKLKDPLPILLLFVTRLDDRIGPVLEGQVRIELRGLTPDEQVRLVENRFAVRHGAREVCAELVPRVGGNPFFLLEMIDALIERGTIEQRDDALIRPDRPLDSGGGASGAGAANAREVLPSTLEQLLGDRVRELPESERGVAHWLAIAGGPLDVRDLAALEPAADEETVMRLCARGICDRKGEALDFRHPLTRDVTYALLATGRRIAMHRALGEHLATTSLARGLSAAIVARHLVRGESGERAAHFYMEAANAARSSYQMPLAIRNFSKALAYLPDADPRRLAALEALETIFRVLGRRRDRVRHLGDLRRFAGVLKTPRAAALALLRTARFDLDEGRLAHGLPVARQAAEVAVKGALVHLEIEAEALVSEFLRELGDVQGALSACDRALAACEARGKNAPPRARADVLRSRGVLLRRVGRVGEAVDAYVDAVAVFRRTGARRQEARAKDDLAFAMIVQGRYEDAISLALESIRIDLSIGGRFQLAKTLTTIGYAYSYLGDSARALAYLRRAREAHERYGDQDSRTGTLLASAEAHLEAGELDLADTFLGDARALNAATANAYETTHAEVVAAALARARGDAREAIDRALDARRAAEHQALTSFHFYGLALEASARADIGEMHAATLLATTALGAVETLQGCEYGLEIRSLCAEALEKAGSPQAAEAKKRAVDHAFTLANAIREPRLRRRFVSRKTVAKLFRELAADPEKVVVR